MVKKETPSYLWLRFELLLLSWRSEDDVIKMLRGQIISNIFSFRGHITLKPRSKFI